MRVQRTHWTRAAMAGLTLVLCACGRNESAGRATPASPAAGAASSPDTGITSADYGGPGRTGVPSDEAGSTDASTPAESTPVQIRVVAIDPKAPSITALPAGAPAPAAGAKAPDARTIPVLAAATARLQTLKPGDRVTLMCETTGGASGGLSACELVVAIVAEKVPPVAGSSR